MNENNSFFEQKSNNLENTLKSLHNAIEKNNQELIKQHFKQIGELIHRQWGVSMPVFVSDEGDYYKCYLSTGIAGTRLFLYPEEKLLIFPNVNLTYKQNNKTLAEQN